MSTFDRDMRRVRQLVAEALHASDASPILDALTDAESSHVARASELLAANTHEVEILL